MATLGPSQPETNIMSLTVQGKDLEEKKLEESSGASTNKSVSSSEFWCDYCNSHHRQADLFLWSRCEHKWSRQCAHRIIMDQLKEENLPRCRMKKCGRELEEAEACMLLNEEELGLLVSISMKWMMAMNISEDGLSRPMDFEIQDMASVSTDGVQHKAKEDEKQAKSKTMDTLSSEEKKDDGLMQKSSDQTRTTKEDNSNGESFECMGCHQMEKKATLFNWSSCKHAYSKECATNAVVEQLTMQIMPFCRVTGCQSILLDLDAKALLLPSIYNIYINVSVNSSSKPLSFQSQMAQQSHNTSSADTCALCKAAKSTTSTVQLKNCGHQFCKGCIGKSIINQIGLMNIFPPNCPICHVEFCYLQIKHSLNCTCLLSTLFVCFCLDCKTLKKAWKVRKQASTRLKSLPSLPIVGKNHKPTDIKKIITDTDDTKTEDWNGQGMPDIRTYCLTPDCGEEIADPNNPYFACGKCGLIWCLWCKTEWHFGMTCGEYEQQLVEMAYHELGSTNRENLKGQAPYQSEFAEKKDDEQSNETNTADSQLQSKDLNKSTNAQKEDKLQPSYNNQRLHNFKHAIMLLRTSCNAQFVTIN
ncbi:hypothetical protein RFI_15190 [Reticulomyxa filosa]|uniref:RING-type domain-containing protein n=1 Tax=Reticulomyxa filosa TaxID=46433 RepID=X6N8E6_RETFI|nr:hypothetical protein RFI_15190 [Reticulomyxa filosa]|eukprot:ETO22014.1 hypothetical protein RFI_15190 [Reticulomyxa filosa]